MNPEKVLEFATMPKLTGAEMEQIHSNYARMVANVERIQSRYAHLEDVEKLSICEAIIATIKVAPPGAIKIVHYGDY